MKSKETKPPDTAGRQACCIYKQLSRKRDYNMDQLRATLKEYTRTTTLERIECIKDDLASMEKLLTDSAGWPPCADKLRLRRLVSLARSVQMTHLHNMDPTDAAGELFRRAGIPYNKALSIADILAGDSAVLYTLQPPTEIAKDLAALNEEFNDGFVFHRNHQGNKVNRLHVTTDAISLKDKDDNTVDLGRFEIKLETKNFTYKVEALDNDDDRTVTHPHIRDADLCEGEATLSINAALNEGRLLDFFMLVRSVLMEYNPDSAYVTLENWNEDEDNATCADCSYSDHEDNMHSCSRCNNVLCEECVYSCTQCDRSVCGDCSTKCYACENRFCDRDRCLEELHKCVECDEEFCVNCAECCEGEGDNTCDNWICKKCARGTSQCTTCHDKESAAREAAAQAEADEEDDVQTDVLSVALENARERREFDYETGQKLTPTDG